ncbi:MAG: methionyl-tRNA formyltransferase [Candidatus Sacchiramonaceae bacterium]|nr:methionyl-tRNA formyltransferase [Candidatus Saccharimonadaceae bacterium]
MNVEQKPIIFFGTEDFSAIALERLIEDGFNIAGVITKPDSKKGRGQKISMPKVKEIALLQQIPVFQPQKMSKTAEFIQQFDQPAGVLVSFGRIIPQNIIDLFTPGIINLHPSLLPKYRGPSPIESAILNGDQETGISIMQLSAKMDAGPVYYQETIPLSGGETSSDLYETTAKIGSKALSNALPAIFSGKMSANPQNDTEATYCKLLSKNDSLLGPSKMTANEAERQVRAYEMFPKTKLQIGDFLCVITEATAINNPELVTPLDIKFKDGQYLSIKKLITPNGKQADAKSFINGYLK